MLRLVRTSPRLGVLLTGVEPLLDLYGLSLPGQAPEGGDPACALAFVLVLL